MSILVASLSSDCLYGMVTVGASICTAFLFYPILSYDNLFSIDWCLHLSFFHMIGDLIVIA